MPTANPTADDFINLLPSELGATVYVEIIIVDQNIGTTNVTTNTDCGRACGSVSGLRLWRDLYRPGMTIKAMLNAKGRHTVDYAPYYRDYNTNTLTGADYSSVALTRTSVLYVHKSIGDGQLRLAMTHIGSHREVLPSRQVK